MLLAFLALIAMFNFLVAVPLPTRPVLSEYRDAVMNAVNGNAVLLKSVPGCLTADLPENTASCITATSEWATKNPALAHQPASLGQSTPYNQCRCTAAVAWLMGVSWDQAQSVGQLLGLKTIVNEFVAQTCRHFRKIRGEWA